jgi:uncharacterized protein YkwD
VPSKSVCIGLASCALFAHAFVAVTEAQVSQQRDAAVVTAQSRSTARNSQGPAALADTGDAARRVVDLTNAFRRQENLPPTGPAPQLASAARYFADFMARTGKFSHTADGSEPAARAKRFGYDYCIVSENIAYVFSSEGTDTAELARRVVEGWQKSPGHRKNMLDPNVTETAVAIARSPRTDYYYAVQLFGKPKSQMIEFKIANRTGAGVEYTVDGQTFQLPTRATSTHRVCNRPAVEFRGKTLQPAAGQQLVIVNDQNGMQVQVQ